MKNTFKKHSNKSTLTLHDFNTDCFNEDYKLKMILNNHIDCMLETSFTLVDMSPTLTFDISKKHSLSSFLETAPVDDVLLFNIFSSLYRLCNSLNSFFLDDKYILLHPDYIFLNPETKDVFYCYCPIEEKDTCYDFTDNLKSLLDFFITKLDYDNSSCVSMCYYVHRKCEIKNFSIEDLIKKGYEPFTSPDKTFETLKNEDSPAPTPEHKTDTDFKLFIKLNILSKYSVILLSILILAVGIFLYIAKISSVYILYFCLLTGITLLFLALPYLNKKLKQNRYLDEHSSGSENILLPEPIGDTVLIYNETNQISPCLVYTGTDCESKTDLDVFPFTIGKIQDNSNMIINSPLISRIHARIYKKENSYYIEDLNSSNGTYINSRLINAHSMIELNDGDMITFANLTYLFKLGSS